MAGAGGFGAAAAFEKSAQVDPPSVVGPGGRTAAVPVHSGERLEPDSQRPDHRAEGAAGPGTHHSQRYFRAQYRCESHSGAKFSGNAGIQRQSVPDLDCHCGVYLGGGCWNSAALCNLQLCPSAKAYDHSNSSGGQPLSQRTDQLPVCPGGNTSQDLLAGESGRKYHGPCYRS